MCFTDTPEKRVGLSLLPRGCATANLGCINGKLGKLLRNCFVLSIKSFALELGGTCVLSVIFTASSN